MTNTARFIVLKTFLWRHISPCCIYRLLQPAISHGAAIIPCCSQNYPMVRQLSLATARIIPWCCLLFRAIVRAFPCCCRWRPAKGYSMLLPKIIILFGCQLVLVWPAMASLVKVRCACYCRRASLNGAGPHGAPASPSRADTLPRDAVVGPHGAAAGPRGVCDN